MTTDRGDARPDGFHITVITLFAEFFDSPLKTSIVGKAIERERISVDFVNPRDFTTDRHRTVDDTPYGGGPGMVLKPEPMAAAIDAARSMNPAAPVVLLTPQGDLLTTEALRKLAELSGVTLVCGRYEGFDERIREWVDAELSVGDYVLSGGEPAALVLIDGVARWIDGVLGNTESRAQESHGEPLLEYPQYTRPPEFRGARVPDILLSGDHGRIDRWRRALALERTRLKRPDLMEKYQLTEFDRDCLREFSHGLQSMEISRGRKTDYQEN